MENLKSITIDDFEFYAKVKEEVKELIGNRNGFYDGIWKVLSLNLRKDEGEVELIHLERCISITRKLNEVDFFKKETL